MDKRILDKYRRPVLKAAIKKKEMFDICIGYSHKLDSIDTLVDKVYISRGSFFNYYNNLDNFMIQLYKYIVLKEYGKCKTINLEEIMKSYAYTGFISHLLNHFLDKKVVEFSQIEFDLYLNDQISSQDIDYILKQTNDKQLFASILYKMM